MWHPARKFLLLALLLCFAPLKAQAQSGFIQVSGTITDPQGFPYAGGSTTGATISAILVPSGGTSPTLHGKTFATSVGPVALGNDGSFTIALADNTVVLPSGTQWQFTVVGTSGLPWPIGRGSQAFNVTLQIHGNGLVQDISTQLSAAAPSLTNVCANSNLPDATACGSGGITGSVSPSFVPFSDAPNDLTDSAWEYGTHSAKSLSCSGGLSGTCEIDILGGSLSFYESQLSSIDLCFNEGSGGSPICVQGNNDFSLGLGPDANVDLSGNLTAHTATLPLIAAPSNPASGNAVVWVDSTANSLECKLSSGAPCLDSPTVFNVKNFGAVGNAKKVVDCTASGAGSPVTVTSATANFTSADLHKVLMQFGPGYVNIGLSTITAVNSSTSVTVSGTSGGALSGASCVWATQDDAPAFQAAFNAAHALIASNFSTSQSGPILGEAPLVYAPSGGYILGSQLAFVTDTFGSYNFGISFNGDPGNRSTVFYPGPNVANLLTETRVYGFNTGNFFIDGSGNNYNLSGSPANNLLQFGGVESSVHDISIFNYGAIGGGATLQMGDQYAKNGHTLKNISIQDSGSTGGGVFPNNTLLHISEALTGDNIFVSNAYGAPNMIIDAGVRSGSGYQVVINGYQGDECFGLPVLGCVEILGGAQPTINGSTFWESSGGYSVYVDGTSTLYLDNSIPTNFTQSNNFTGILVAPGGTVHLMGDTLAGEGSGVGINNQGTVWDDGGNTFIHCVSGTCSTATAIQQFGGSNQPINAKLSTKVSASSFTFVQAPTSNVCSSGTTCAKTISGVVAGDLLVAEVAFFPFNSVTPSNGIQNFVDSTGDVWIPVLINPQQQGGGAGVQVFYDANASAGSHTLTATFFNTLTYAEVLPAEYGGAALLGTLDVYAQASGSTNTAAAGPITTAVAGELVLGFLVQSVSTTYTASSGFTIRSTNPTGSTQALVLEDKLNAAQGSYTPGFTWTGSPAWDMIAVAFKPNGGLPAASSRPIATEALVTDAVPNSSGTCVGGGSTSLIAVDNGTAWWCNAVPAGVNPVLTGTTGSIGGSALLAGQCAAGTVSVTGATSAMVATASPSSDPDSNLSTGVGIYAFVSGSNTVTVRVCAIVAVTPAATTYNVRVLQ